MHKFTIFTILLSVIVIFVVAELVVNDYMGDDFASEEITEEVVEEDEIPAEPITEEVVADVDPELRGDEAEVGETEEVITEETTYEAVLTQEIFAQTGVTEPVLTTSFYDGLVYGFWDTSEEFAELTVLKHKLFDGADYLGTVYEIQPNSAIDLFTTYETLRSVAEASETGEINENNAYGEASFYFNHDTKISMVFLVLRQNGVIYAFEYSPSYHSQMSSLIELL